MRKPVNLISRRSCLRRPSDSGQSPARCHTQRPCPLSLKIESQSSKRPDRPFRLLNVPGGAPLFRTTSSTQKINVHRALAVPPGPAPRGAKRALYARATPSFFKLPWYSSVAIRAEQDGEPAQDWHAEVRLFLSCHLTRYDGPDEIRELALVRYYKELSAPDVVLGCRRLRWESAANQYRIINVRNILRLEHILPDFSSPGGFFISRFLFEH